MKDRVSRCAAEQPTLRVQPNINLHIEELVLRGFGESERYRLAGALERELTQLFSKQRLPALLARTADIRRLDGGAFEMSAGNRPELIGAQLAQTVYRSLARPRLSPARSWSGKVGLGAAPSG
jgi:hypothetical protein